MLLPYSRAGFRKIGTLEGPDNGSIGPESNSELVKAKKQGSENLTLHGGFEIPAGNLAESAGSPRVAAAADFNGDGIGDLAVAYNNGLAIYRGDINAFAPQTDAAWQAINDGRFVSPFKTDVRTLSVPVAADFVQTGDFNRDTHVDIAFAMRGDNSLFVLEGDGKANFPNLRRIETDGNITTLTAADVNLLDGLPDLIVGVTGANGSELQIYQGLGDVLVAVPANRIAGSTSRIDRGRTIETGFSNRHAVAGGGEVVILSGKDAIRVDGGPVIENLRLPQASGSRLQLFLIPLFHGSFNPAQKHQ